MRRRDLLAAAAGAIVATALAGGIAWAAIPEGGVIQSCYDSGGNVKVVQTLPCPKGYTPLAWNQQGPQGLQGPQGVQGPKGDKGDAGEPGPAGPSGVSGYEVITVTRVFAPAEEGVVIAECPQGKAILQGNYSTNSPLFTQIREEIYGLFDPPQLGVYALYLLNSGPFEATVVARASCIAVT